MQLFLLRDRLIVSGNLLYIRILLYNMVFELANPTGDFTHLDTVYVFKKFTKEVQIIDYGPSKSNEFW